MNDAVSEVSEQIGVGLTLVHLLTGGEQGGAYLVTAPDKRRFVLKLQPDHQKAARLLAAVPVVRHAVAHGWPAAPWLHAGTLHDGSAFLLQEYVAGTSPSRFDASTMQAVIAANRLQSGLAVMGATDDSAHLHSVATGEHPWTEIVRSHSAAGASLVKKGNEVIRELGQVRAPVSDVIHGDYSASNMIRSDAGKIFFIDSETVASGTRARDLADLYRQSFLLQTSSPSALRALHDEGCAAAGADVFRMCVVAVTYDNLAWQASHRSSEAFDDACRSLEELFEQL